MKADLAVPSFAVPVALLLLLYTANIIFLSLLPNGQLNTTFYAGANGYGIFSIWLLHRVRLADFTA